jgi:hypothetical protein
VGWWGGGLSASANIDEDELIAGLVMELAHEASVMVVRCLIVACGGTRMCVHDMREGMGELYLPIYDPKQEEVCSLSWHHSTSVWFRRGCALSPSIILLMSVLVQEEEEVCSLF